MALRAGSTAHRGNLQLLQKLSTKFLEYAPGRLASLQQAILSHDLVRAEGLVYALKWTATFLEAPRWRQAAAAMELAANAEDTHQASFLPAEVETEL